MGSQERVLRLSMGQPALFTQDQPSRRKWSGGGGKMGWSRNGSFPDETVVWVGVLSIPKVCVLNVVTSPDKKVCCWFILFLTCIFAFPQSCSPLEDPLAVIHDVTLGKRLHLEDPRGKMFTVKHGSVAGSGSMVAWRWGKSYCFRVCLRIHGQLTIKKH